MGRQEVWHTCKKDPEEGSAEIMAMLMGLSQSMKSVTGTG